MDPSAPTTLPHLWQRAALRGPLLSAILAAVVWAIVLRHTYLYDDVSRIPGDDRLNSPAASVELFTGRYNEGVDNLYRPVTSFSFAVQAWIVGTDEEAAWFYHGLNLLLYAGVTFLVARLAVDLSGGSGLVGLAAGGLFATHPVHAEVVGMVVGRGELLCAIGFLGGTLLALQPLTRGRIVAMLGCLALAIGSKEQGLVLPVMFAVIMLARWTGDKVGSWPRIKEMVALLTLFMAAYLVFRESILPMAWERSDLDYTIQPMIRAQGLDRWTLWLIPLGHALQLLVLPAVQSIDYGSNIITPPTDFGSVYVWAGVVALLLWTAGLLHAIRQRWTAGLIALLGVAITYGPVANLLTVIGTIFGARLLFLPSAFFVIYVVLLGQRFVQSATQQRVAAGLVAMTCIAFAGTGLMYVRPWNDRLAAYLAQAETFPQSIRLQLLVADEARQRGEFELATKHVDAAIALDPDYFGSQMTAAKIARDRGDLDTALVHAQRAVELARSLVTVGLRKEIMDQMK